MTRLIIYLFIATAFAIPWVSPEPSVDVKNDAEAENKVDTNIIKTGVDGTSSNSTNTEKPPQKTVVTNVVDSFSSPDSGAFLRLFLVLLGICTIGLMYVFCRFYRTQKGGPQPTTVRKYGVLTQRTDIEMLPLPLDDDEDDDTVFDVGNHVNR